VRFLVDECCDAALVDGLRADEHDVVYAVESMRGAPDGDVLALAVREHRILITEDKDFGELVYRLQRPAHGIVFLRFEFSEREAKLARLRSVVADEEARLAAAYVVLEPDKLRIRPLIEQ
jgi:predicted nuclease of predicted toxin-antitoxin system